jgi:mannose-6-phosphate isomerase-like protein (cupin superfamily)
MENKKFAAPYLITFPKVGSSEIGYISIAEISDLLPFEIKRTFWTYFTPESVVRGRHAHYKTEQILVAVSGRIIVNLLSAIGDEKVFVLDRPDIGLYIPPNVWHTMQYNHFAVQMVFTSTIYNESDYIRDFELFKNVYKNSPNS